MKINQFVLLIIGLISLTNQSQKLVTYSNFVIDYWPPSALAEGLGVPGYARNNQYNYHLLTFWLSKNGACDTALIFENPIGFFSKENPWNATTNEELQAAILKQYHDAGHFLLISAFGATEFPTIAKSDPVITCTNLAQWVLKHKLDGVDIDWEDNDALELGTGEQWLITCTKTIRSILPKGKYILTHAPQAPYFINNGFYPNGGYMTVHKEVGDLIDWYNVQFYNQGPTTTYDTYEKLFLKSGGDWPLSSVKEIIDKGIDKEKIVIGKPVTKNDASNTGLISASDFGTWAARANKEFGWQSGIMTWQFSSDISGKYINTYLQNCGFK